MRLHFRIEFNKAMALTSETLQIIDHEEKVYLELISATSDQRMKKALTMRLNARQDERAKLTAPKRKRKEDGK
jgi:hypothetical protein